MALARMEDERSGNTGSPVNGVARTNWKSVRSTVWVDIVADRSVILKMWGNSCGGKGPRFESSLKRSKGMTTDENLSGSDKVRRLQRTYYIRMHNLVCKPNAGKRHARFDGGCWKLRDGLD